MKVFYAFVFLAGITCAQEPVEVISSEGEYPASEPRYQNEETGETCQCQTNASVTEWNTWSSCTGQSAGSFGCHRGQRYRRRECAEISTKCRIIQFQDCYHEETCTGEWTEWIDSSVNTCSHTCGSGVRARIRMCSKGSRIGLFCASEQRRPYDITYEECNTQPCETSAPRENDTDASDCIPRFSNKEANAESGFTPNYLTWTVVGVGAVLLLLVSAIVMSLYCYRTTHRHQAKVEQNEENQPDKNARATLQQEYYSEINLDGFTQSNNKKWSNTTLQNKTISSDNDRSHHYQVVMRNNPPVAPPILHNSYFEGQVIPSENPCYTLVTPSHSSHKEEEEMKPPSVLEDLASQATVKKQTNIIKDIPETATYMGINSAEEANIETATYMGLELTEEKNFESATYMGIEPLSRL